MNLRRRIAQEPLTFQLAPFIDVTMFLLCFFLLTWNVTRYETDLQVKTPTAAHGKEPQRLPGEAIVNVRKDGTIVLQGRQVTYQELEEVLRGITKAYPDQVLVLRADEKSDYKHVVKVLDACRAADLWNIAFATTPPEKSEQP
jgi:biopolymer transport protein ExbD